VQKDLKEIKVSKDLREVRQKDQKDRKGHLQKDRRGHKVLHQKDLLVVEDHKVREVVRVVQETQHKVELDQQGHQLKVE
jgi:hypothetical protein